MDTLIFVAACALFIGGFRPDVLTCIFLLIMIAVMIMCTMGPKNKIKSLNQGLYSLLNELRQIDKSEDMVALFNRENGTVDDFLNKQLKEYALSTKKNKDISDYLSDGLIDSYVKRDLLNWIPSLFTALGILGTFVGLIIGLHRFDPSTADGIMNSITALMNGIKVAFYTSIFGIGASILFNLFYKKEWGLCEERLNEFFDYISNYINPEAEHLKKLEALEERKTKAWERLAGDIADELAIAINNSVVPTMQDLKNATFGYIEKAVQAQSGTLEMLVKGFMEQMNKAMKNQFLNMSESIKELCSWQNNTSDKLSEIFKQLEITIEKFDGVSLHMKTISDNHKSIESSLSLSIEKIINYVQTLEDYQSMSRRWVEEMKEFTANNLEVSKTFVAVPERIEELIFEIDKFKNSTNEFNAKVAEGAMAYDNQINSIIQRFAENSARFVEEINSASLSNIEIQKNLSEKMADQFNKYELSVQSAVERINNSVIGFTQSVDKTVEAFGVKGDKLIKESKEIDKIEHKLNKDIEEMVNKLVSQISESTDKLEKQLDGITNGMATIDDVKNVILEGNTKLESLGETVRKATDGTVLRRSLFRWEGRKTEE